MSHVGNWYGEKFYDFLNKQQKTNEDCIFHSNPNRIFSREFSFS